VTRWVATPAPNAQLTPDSQNPPVVELGNTWEFFVTAFGVRFARITTPGGFTYWRKEVASG
jgi:hypothetical protein